MTNPTERPEEDPLLNRYVKRVFGRPERPEGREGAVADQGVSGDESVASTLAATQEPSSRMTERPEERDLLSEIEERLAEAEEFPNDWRNVSPLLADLRTLINEVKERDEAFVSMREERNGFFNLTRELEAEVKQLREENARLERRERGSAEAMVTWSERCVSAEYKRKQMEEALRGIAEYPHKSVLIHTDAESMRAIARAALSPSDTEEEA